MDDRRINRTRTAIFEAFAQLVQTTRFDQLRATEIIETAGIGKSTFYEHFSDKFHVLSESLEGPMKKLSGCVSPDPKASEIESILDHFWERRALARVVLQPPARQYVLKCLTDQIVERLLEIDETSPPIRMARAIFLAEGILGVLDQWLAGKLVISKSDVQKLILQQTKQYLWKRS